MFTFLPPPKTVCFTVYQTFFSVWPLATSDKTTDQIDMKISPEKSLDKEVTINFWK